MTGGRTVRRVVGGAAWTGLGGRPRFGTSAGSTVLNRSSSLFRGGGAGSRPNVCTRSSAAARSGRPWTAAHRSITSPFWPQRGVEAVEDVLVEVHAEGAAAGVAAVHRTGAAPLRTAAAQPRRQAQVIEHPRQRQLPLEVGEVDGSALADRPRRRLRVSAQAAVTTVRAGFAPACGPRPGSSTCPGRARPCG